MASKLNKFDSLNKWLNRYRSWFYVDKLSKNTSNLLLKKNQLNFTLMSYNILSEDYLSKYPNLYSFCPPKVLKWPGRGLRIVQEIEINNPDIICLQEVHLDHYTDFYTPELKMKGYDSIFKVRDTRFDGCAIYFKKNKFNLLKSKEINLWREDLSKVLNAPNVGLIAMLEPIENENVKINNCLVVATTHIIFSPKRGDTKLAQSRLLLAEIEQMALRSVDKNGQKSYFPFIFAGDFNILPNSSVYQFIENGFLDCQYLDSYSLSGHIRSKINRFMKKDQIKIDTVESTTEFSSDTQNESNQKDLTELTHNLNLKSVFRPENNSNRSFVTTKHNEACETVDYIFYHQTKELDLVAFRRLISQDIAYRDVPYLPNELIGSDHFSLVAKFSLHNKKI